MESHLAKMEQAYADVQKEKEAMAAELAAMKDKHKNSDATIQKYS